MKTLVVGLGNPVLSDDSVGLQVLHQLEPQLRPRADVETRECCRGGLDLMEDLVGADRAIIVDAICSGAEPGTVHHLMPSQLPTQHSSSIHDVNLATALQLGRQAGVPLPDDDQIMLIGVEAQDVATFGEQCTPRVEAAIPRAAEAVLAALPDPPPSQPGEEAAKP